MNEDQDMNMLGMLKEEWQFRRSCKAMDEYMRNANGESIISMFMYAMLCMDMYGMKINNSNVLACKVMHEQARSAMWNWNSNAYVQC